MSVLLSYSLRISNNAAHTEPNFRHQYIVHRGKRTATLTEGLTKTAKQYLKTWHPLKKRRKGEAKVKDSKACTIAMFFPVPLE